MCFAKIRRKKDLEKILRFVREFRNELLLHLLLRRNDPNKGLQCSQYLLLQIFGLLISLHHWRAPKEWKKEKQPRIWQIHVCAKWRRRYSGHCRQFISMQLHLNCLPLSQAALLIFPSIIISCEWFLLTKVHPPHVNLSVLNLVQSNDFIVRLVCCCCSLYCCCWGVLIYWPNYTYIHLCVYFSVIVVHRRR